MTAFSTVIKTGAATTTREHGASNWREALETLAIAAHELRSPLVAAHALIEALSRKVEESADPSEIKDLVPRLKRQISRADELLIDILGLNDLRVSTEPQLVQAVNIREVFERASGAAITSVEQNVHVQIPASLRALADARSLEQVFVNLLNNAAQYGGPTIEVGAAARADHLEIWFADDGDGIPPSLVVDLFKPFARGLNAENATGSGLGLAISREITRELGGDLYHENRIPRGARFVVVLKRA